MPQGLAVVTVPAAALLDAAGQAGPEREPAGERAAALAVTRLASHVAEEEPGSFSWQGARSGHLRGNSSSGGGSPILASAQAAKQRCSAHTRANPDHCRYHLASRYAAAAASAARCQSATAAAN